MGRITLRLPDDLHSTLKRRSYESDTSLNETIVTLLRERLARYEYPMAQTTPLERERSRIREALGDLVVQYQPEDFAPFVKRPPTEIDREALFRSMAGVNLSAAIVEERNESSY
jgi:hypothetical protein